MRLVRHQGPNNWVRISQHLRNRSPKQCRERYHQSLKATLHHGPISPQEGELIEQLVEELGKRWAEIARRLGNRSDNAVKNWWNGSVNRRKRRAPARDNLRADASDSIQSLPRHESDARPQYAPPSLLPPSHLQQDRLENGRSLQQSWMTDPMSATRYLQIAPSSDSLPPIHRVASPRIISNNELPSIRHAAQPNRSHDDSRRDSTVRLPWIFDQQSDESRRYERDYVSYRPMDHTRTPSIQAPPSLSSDCSSYQSLSPRTTSSVDAHDVAEPAIHVVQDACFRNVSLRLPEDHYTFTARNSCSSLAPLVSHSGSNDLGQNSPTRSHPISSSRQEKDKRMMMSSLIQ